MERTAHKGRVRVFEPPRELSEEQVLGFLEDAPRRGAGGAPAPAQIEDVATVREDTDHQPQRVHALPLRTRELDNYHTVWEEGSGDSRAPTCV